VHARVLAFAGILFIAGCGSAPSNETSGVRGTLEGLAGGPGLKTVALTPGDADFAPGPIRFSFLVVANDGRPVSKPKADVWIARGYKKKPYLHTTARLERIGVPGLSSHSSLDVPSIYVAELRAPAPGTYWVLAKPQGARIDGIGNVVVRRHSYSPAVGANAAASRTPTLATTGGRLAPLTTATHPDRQLYTTSVAQALAAHVPFVVTFATPKFCTSRTCGPVVDVVSHVRKQLAATAVRFIHVEVFSGNDPARGYNRWMRQWGLQSEPWTFLVGRDGRIKAKFEGPVSVRELRDAVESELAE
jgi:hypothetical protein